MENAVFVYIFPQIMDVLGAAGTWASHRAAMEVSQKSSDHAERYFWALAQLPRGPSDRIVKGYIFDDLMSDFDL